MVKQVECGSLSKAVLAVGVNCLVSLPVESGSHYLTGKGCYEDLFMSSSQLQHAKHCHKERGLIMIVVTKTGLPRAVK